MDDNLIEVELTGMAVTGEAVGHHDRRIVFVPFGIPGERVLARVTEDARRYSRAELVEILTPSLHRAAAPCPHFGTCGGCQWQHIDYAHQLACKEVVVAQQLTHRGPVANAPVRAAIGMSDPWGYRNQVDVLIGAEGGLGFLDVAYSGFVPVGGCMVADPWLWELASGVDLAEAGVSSMSVRTGLNTDDVLIVFETQDDLAPALELDLPVSCVLRHDDGSIVTLAGEPWYREVLGERAFRISANSFFPVNTAALEVLLSVVETGLGLVGYETLLDVFCGVGTYGISLADRVAQVICVDSAGEAIEDATANASAAGCDNVVFTAGEVERALSTVDQAVNAAIITAPHDGCPVATWAALGRIRPQRLVYISENANSLALDAKRIAELGYSLREVQPLDMFPQTSLTLTVSSWSLAR